jgi:hypothetical protein
MYEIESNVPMPGFHVQSAIKETLSKMGVGDSFLIPSPSTNAAIKVRLEAKEVGIKVSIRTVNKIKGDIRIWRTS